MTGRRGLPCLTVGLWLAVSACSSEPAPQPDLPPPSTRSDALPPSEGARPAERATQPFAEAGPFIDGAVGDGVACLLASSGSVYCAETTPAGVPLGEHQAIPDLFDATALAVGDGFACALVEGGAARCWGDGRRGALGPEAGTVESVPVTVTGLPPLIALDAGGRAACGLTEAGEAWCWGDGRHGQTGRGLAPTPSPPEAVEGLAEVDTIAVGSRHACAVDRAGGVTCWGDDRHGQLGRGPRSGATDVPLRPAPVDGLAAARDIVAGDDHTCALTVEDEVICWGANADGQLGTGTTESVSRPTRAAIGRDGRALFTGPDYSCATIADGELQCWGANATGLLSRSLGESVLLPVARALDGLTPDALALGRGAAWTLSEGRALPWTRGEVASGALTPAPGEIPLRGAEPGFLSLGPTSSRGAYCLVDRDGHVCCAGPNDRGQVGDGGGNERGSPVTLPHPVNAREVAVGGAHACAIDGSGGVWCWGDNAQGQIGAPNLGYSRVPLQVAGVGAASSLALGDAHSCALTEAGEVYCWGDGRDGQRGQREVVAEFQPALVTLPERARALAAGDAFTCALLLDGRMPCWGDNSFGQLGTFDVADRATPAMATLATAESPPRALALGARAACVRFDDGRVGCVGSLAEASEDVEWAREASTGLAFDATPRVHMTPEGTGSIAVGDGFLCASGGGVQCVGMAAPELTGSSEATLVAGGRRVCAVRPDASVRCADAPAVELASRSTYAAPPMPLPLTQRGIRAFAGGRAHACALLEDDTLRCWGDNALGQLGQGDTRPVDGPVAVTGLPDIVLIEAAGDQTCVKGANQLVYCWGGAPDRATPSIVEGLAGVVDLSVGAEHVCSTIRGGTVRCAGGNETGQLGRGTAAVGRSSGQTVQALGDARRIASGERHSCALTEDGDVYCWGDNTFGQLGDGSRADALAPRLAADLVYAGDLGRAESIVAGGFSTCVRYEGGAVRCVGSASDVVPEDAQLTELFVSSDAVCGTSSGARLACYSRGVEGPWRWSLPNVTRVVFGTEHLCLHQSTGGLQCWGDAPGGLLPEEALAAVLPDLLLEPPARETHEFAEVTDLDVGPTHTCALVDGEVRCWGDNRDGAVGPEGGVFAVVATPVEGLRATDVSVGENVSCAVSRGRVLCWGNNEEGEAGQGLDVARCIEPTMVEAVEDAVAVEVGRRHACALTGDGVVWCWGDNRAAALGNGTRVRSPQPGAVELPAPAIEIATNDVTSCALLEDGSAWCWGEIRRGAYHTRPTQVSTLRPVVELALGDRHQCVRLENGDVQCWGKNDQAQLGMGVCTDAGRLTTIRLPAPAERLWAGASATCAALEGGTTWCWGTASFVPERYQSLVFPAAVPELDGALGIWPMDYVDSCRADAEGAVSCWPHDGRTGENVRGACDSLTPVSPASELVDDYCVGNLHVCAVTDERVLCWGGNPSYQTQGTHGAPNPTPTVFPLPQGATGIRCGEGHTCAIGDDSYLRCWGANQSSQIHPTAFQLARRTVVPEPGPVRDASLGDQHSCAIDAEGLLICWGDDRRGQVGPRNPVTFRADDLGPVAQVVTGRAHTCARMPDDTVLCWGDNTSGQLGRAAPQDREPAPVEGLPPVRDLAAGTTHTCAIDGEAALWCWGDNLWGQLGDGSNTSRGQARAVDGLPPVREVALGRGVSCALTEAGVYCWGDNREGAVGDAAQVVTTPTLVGGTEGLTSLEVGGGTVCGTRDSRLWCWGAGTLGQLGLRQ